MAEDTALDPALARRIFNITKSIGMDIDAALKELEGIRAQIVEPWGQDEYGKKFSQKREPNAKELISYVDDLISSLRKLSEEGQTAIGQIQEQDHVNGEDLAPN